MTDMRNLIDKASAVKPGLYPTFELWSVAANAALEQNYGINYPDAGADEDDMRRWYEDHLQTGETVEDCARAYAEDYDLEEVDEMTKRHLVQKHPIPPPPGGSALDEAPPPSSTDKSVLFKAAKDALNTCRNTKLNGKFKDSYALASAMTRFLNGDTTYSEDDLFQACRYFLNQARNFRLDSNGFKTSYDLAAAFDRAA